MKLDLYTNNWIEIVFQGRNKSYGAYELRKSSTKTNIRALITGALIFTFLVSSPMIIDFLPSSKNKDTINTSLVAVKLQAKEKPKDDIKKFIPPPPPKPKFDQVKFVKPVIAKADDVVEEIVKIDDIKDKHIGKETVAGDPNAELTIEEPGTGPPAEIVEDTQVYNLAGIEVKPGFAGGIEKFYDFVGRNFVTPEECPGGRLVVTFVVEKDGTLTDIKILKDIGYGAGKEAVRVLKKCPKWTPGEQNGKPVRVQYSLPISIQAAE